MNQTASTSAPIGIFDSGYGGLTILQKMRLYLPQYDFIYLGDNARAPYGSRSFEVVYDFTRQAVQHLFGMGSPLVILACNTASAKALRSIQQNDLPHIDPQRRVLGVIRPTVEEVCSVTKNGHIGVLGTSGTIASQSYPLELSKLSPDLSVTGKACPMWVPLIEYHEANQPGADYFVKKYLDELFQTDPLIDTIILGCTHYPLLISKIRKYLPENVHIVSQGDIVARSLVDYLKRHPEMDQRISKNGQCTFFTTESETRFAEFASIFFKEPVSAHRIASLSE